MRQPGLLRFALGVALALLGGAVSVRSVAADGVANQQAEVKRVLAEIDALDQKSGQFAELGAQALDLKSQLDAEIVVAQSKIAAQQAELNALAGQLSDVAVQKVMGGGSGALGPLFTDPTAIDDGLQRDHLARVAVNAGAATTDDFEALLSALDKEQKALEKKQKKATDLAANAETNRIAADKAAKEATARLKQAKAKLGVLIDQERQRQAAEAKRQFQQKLAAQQAAAAAARRPTPGAGGSATGGGSSSSSGGSQYVAVSGQAGVAIAAAQSQLGVPWVFATMIPGVAFDCSGLTAWSWGRAGVALPHQSRQQYAALPHVPASAAQPGDLIFYYTPISHVGIYLGGGEMIHSPQSGSSVSYAPVHWDKVVGVGRPG
jgi:cell wall-associated NlpC family hydrolase